jgi:hypothetical protein
MKIMFCARIASGIHELFEFFPSKANSLDVGTDMAKTISLRDICAYLVNITNQTLME